jgi:hypothetical protein
LSYSTGYFRSRDRKRHGSSRSSGGSRRGRSRSTTPNSSRTHHKTNTSSPEPKLRQPFVAISARDDGGEKEYPQQMVKYTKCRPSLSYCENPHTVPGYFKSRDELFNSESVEVVDIMKEFINSSTSTTEELNSSGLAALQVSYEGDESEEESATSPKKPERPWFIKDDEVNTLASLNLLGTPAPKVSSKPSTDNSDVVRSKWDSDYESEHSVSKPQEKPKQEEGLVTEYEEFLKVVKDEDMEVDDQAPEVQQKVEKSKKKKTSDESKKTHETKKKRKKRHRDESKESSEEPPSKKKKTNKKKKKKRSKKKVVAESSDEEEEMQEVKKRKKKKSKLKKKSKKAKKVSSSENSTSDEEASPSKSKSKKKKKSEQAESSDSSAETKEVKSKHKKKRDSSEDGKKGKDESKSKKRKGEKKRKGKRKHHREASGESKSEDKSKDEEGVKEEQEEKKASEETEKSKRESAGSSSEEESKPKDESSAVKSDEGNSSSSSSSSSIVEKKKRRKKRKKRRKKRNRNNSSSVSVSSNTSSCSSSTNLLIHENTTDIFSCLQGIGGGGDDLINDFPTSTVDVELPNNTNSSCGRQQQPDDTLIDTQKLLDDVSIPLPPNTPPPPLPITTVPVTATTIPAPTTNSNIYSPSQISSHDDESSSDDDALPPKTESTRTAPVDDWDSSMSLQSLPDTRTITSPSLIPFPPNLYQIPMPVPPPPVVVPPIQTPSPTPLVSLSTNIKTTTSPTKIEFKPMSVKFKLKKVAVHPEFLEEALDSDSNHAPCKEEEITPPVPPVQEPKEPIACIPVISSHHGPSNYLVSPVPDLKSKKEPQIDLEPYLEGIAPLSSLEMVKTDEEITPPKQDVKLSLFTNEPTERKSRSRKRSPESKQESRWGPPVEVKTEPLIEQEMPESPQKIIETPEKISPVKLSEIPFEIEMATPVMPIINVKVSSPPPRSMFMNPERKSPTPPPKPKTDSSIPCKVLQSGRNRSRSPPKVKPRSPPKIRSKSPPKLRLSPPNIRSRSPPKVRSKSPPSVRPKSPPSVRPRSPPKQLRLSPPRIRSLERKMSPDHRDHTPDRRLRENMEHRGRGLDERKHVRSHSRERKIMKSRSPERPRMRRGRSPDKLRSPERARSPPRRRSPKMRSPRPRSPISRSPKPRSPDRFRSPEPKSRLRERPRSLERFRSPEMRCRPRESPPRGRSPMFQPRSPLRRPRTPDRLMSPDRHRFRSPPRAMTPRSPDRMRMMSPRSPQRMMSPGFRPRSPPPERLRNRSPRSPEFRPRTPPHRPRTPPESLSPPDRRRMHHSPRRGDIRWSNKPRSPTPEFLHKPPSPCRRPRTPPSPRRGHRSPPRRIMRKPRSPSPPRRRRRNSGSYSPPPDYRRSKYDDAGPSRWDKPTISGEADMDLSSPGSSPLVGLKRSVADSTISDSELTSSKDEFYYDKRYTEAAYYENYEEEEEEDVRSPRRLSLDERIDIELGVKKDVPHQQSQQIPVYQAGYPNYPAQYYQYYAQQEGEQSAQQYGFETQQHSSLIQVQTKSETNWDNPEAFIGNQPQPSSSRVVQVSVASVTELTVNNI